MNTEKSWNTHAPSTTLVKPSYGFIDTSEIISRFERQGWTLFKAKQANVRKPENEGYQSHLLTFHNESLPMIYNLHDNNKSRVTLNILNSHDGKRALQGMLGVFRMACLNGVLAGDAFSRIRVIHSESKIKNLDTAIEQLVDNVPELISKIQKFSQFELSLAQKISLAKKAAALRFMHVHNVESVHAEDILRPMRHQDRSQDAYSVFNVVQEKIIRGGISYKKYVHNPLNKEEYRIENATTRAISSVTQSVKYNRELWNILEDVCS